MEFNIGFYGLKKCGCINTFSGRNNFPCSRYCLHFLIGQMILVSWPNYFSKLWEDT